MGGIALATAPAPVLSIIKEFKVEGPVTRTLIPLAVIDDVISIIIFFTSITLISSFSNVPGLEPWKIVTSIIYPIGCGVILGFLFGLIGKFCKNDILLFVFFILLLLIFVSTNFLFDFLVFKGTIFYMEYSSL